MSVREIILIRHGESAGNVAREQALRTGAHRIDIDLRDADVWLTGLGRHQAGDLGSVLGDHLRDGERVEVWCSPYRRAIETVTIALERAELEHRPLLDERLRDRELGILDRLTADGIAAQFPDEADRRQFLGKLYYRPPGGESWSDVALRIRSFVADRRNDDVDTILVSTHDAVIMLFRYVLEGLSEAELMELARLSVRNGSLTRLVKNADGDTDKGWYAASYDSGDHLTEPTRAPAKEDHA